ncbi:hypothetical protein KCU86_g4494, partial [Aureobasidium melanogenum]
MIPVICTTNIEPELINEFLVKAYAADTDAPEDLCVLTTQDWSHYRNEARLSPEEAQKQGYVAAPRGEGPMESPSRPPWTKRFETPFKNRNSKDIAQTLRSAEGLLSSMNKEFCIVFDEQTVQDKNSAKRERANLLSFPTQPKQSLEHGEFNAFHQQKRKQNVQQQGFPRGHPL